MTESSTDDSKQNIITEEDKPQIWHEAALESSDYILCPLGRCSLSTETVKEPEHPLFPGGRDIFEIWHNPLNVSELYIAGRQWRKRKYMNIDTWIWGAHLPGGERSVEWLWAPWEILLPCLIMPPRFPHCHIRWCFPKLLMLGLSAWLSNLEGLSPHHFQSSLQGNGGILRQCSLYPHLLRIFEGFSGNSAILLIRSIHAFMMLFTI